MAGAQISGELPVVVLYTNLVLSALVFAGGRLVPLRAAWQSGRIVPLLSAATASALMHVLGYPKFKLSAEDRQELLADYLPHCRSVRLPERLPKLPQCRDAVMPTTRCSSSWRRLAEQIFWSQATRICGT